MWELDHKESWMLKNWCFWTVVLEKTLESPLDSKIKPVSPKGNQPWIFIGRTDDEAPILWPPDAKNWLIRKDTNTGKGWRQEEKGKTEDEMVEWHHRLNGHESEQAPGVGDGQGSLACCSPQGRKELDTTEWLNWTQGWACYFAVSKSLLFLETCILLLQTNIAICCWITALSFVYYLQICSLSMEKHYSNLRKFHFHCLGVE